MTRFEFELRLQQFLKKTLGEKYNPADVQWESEYIPMTETEGCINFNIGISSHRFEKDYCDIESEPDISSTWHPGHEPQMGSYDH